MVVFFRQHFAQDFDVFFSCLRLIETVGVCGGGYKAVQLRRESRV